MILTTTLNASIDKAYELDGALIPGTVMRVARTTNSAGGKGLNVSRIVKLLGHDVLATGCVGGYNGSYLEWLLDQDGIAHNFAHITGETRSCINVLEHAYGSTEFLEKGPELLDHEVSAVIELFEQLIQDASVVTLSGSAPAGAPTTIYAQLINRVRAKHKHVILDTSGASLSAALPACPTLIKPNSDEIAALTGIEKPSLNELRDFGTKQVDAGIDYVLISLGKEGALLCTKRGHYRALPPHLNARNTVGCGDAMVGGCACALEAGADDEELLKRGIAAGSAAALSPKTGDLDPRDERSIYEALEVKQLD